MNKSQGASPKPFPHMRKLRQQTIGAFAFHPLDQATDRDVGRDGDHHMDMICRDMSLQHIDARLLTRFADNGADPFCDLTAQHLVALPGGDGSTSGWCTCRAALVRVVFLLE